MRTSTLLVLASMAIGLAILLSLGTWQVKRLYWKEALIERVNDNLDNPPRPLKEALAEHGDPLPEYLPVEVYGQVENLNASYEFTTQDGRSGWNVFLPFRLDPPEGKLIMVNFGFIPYEAKDHKRSVKYLSENLPGVEFRKISLSPQSIQGLYRLPLREKPGRFVNDNDIQTRTFFWRDVTAMGRHSLVAEPDFMNWYLDAGIPGKVEADGMFPLPGTTRIAFPNNHLQYAITWYGLALALLGVGSYFLYARRRSKAASTTG